MHLLAAPAPIFRHPDRLPPTLAGPVLAIGNFDGLHRGHKALIAEARTLAAGRHPAGLLTFDPHPRAVMRPHEPFFHLSGLKDKALVAGRLGLDLVVALPFDDALRNMSREVFEAALLVERFGVAGIVVGPNFRYGHKRTGDVASLTDAGKRHGYAVRVVPAVHDSVGRVQSSSDIRDRLRAGDVASANAALGHHWFVRGIVAHGDKRGRELGYPTANVHLPQGTALAYGIYAVRARVDGRLLSGVASFGSRPTFDNGAPRLETFLFDFSGDLYGKEMLVEFVGYIRREEKFDSLDALLARMAIDCAQAREILATCPVTGIDSMLAVPA